MNKEIEVGEFIRTEDGMIRKISNANGSKNICGTLYGYLENGEEQYILESKITKHSPNILKVLGNGDLVNGKYIVADIHSYGFYYFEDGGVSQNQIYVGDIKTVITKEQMEKIMYRVEE